MNISGNSFSCPLPDWCSDSICSSCSLFDTCLSFSITPTQSPTPTQTTSTQSPTPTSSPASTNAPTQIPTPTQTTLTQSPTYTTTPNKTPTTTTSSLPNFTILDTTSKTPTNSSSQTRTSSQTTLQNTPSLLLLGPSIINNQIKSISLSPSKFYFNNIPTISPKSPYEINCIKNYCENGKIQREILPNSAVSLLTDSGRTVGNVFFSDIEGFLDINFITNIESNSIGNTIVDITILDLDGNSISELNGPIKICLTQEKTNEDICLSFFNTKTKEWECQDKCLSRENNQYCGTTDHLTSFALLLQGGGNKGGKCDSSENYILAWLSMALLIFAILIIIICVLLNEVRFRLIYQRKKRIMSLMAGTGTESNEDLK